MHTLDLVHVNYYTMKHGQDLLCVLSCVSMCSSTVPCCSIASLNYIDVLFYSTYEWQDGKNKRHTKLPAKEYIDSALTMIQKQLQDETIFPTKFGECVYLL